MPYKKKYVKKRRSFKSRKSPLKKLAKKVNKLYKAVETKHYRVSGLGALPDNNPTLAIRPYPSITQGLSDYGERVGDKVNVKYLKFKSVWELGAGHGTRTGRIIVFIMKNNPDGIATAWSTIWNLYMESAYANGVNIVNGNVDHDNKANFVTLYDKKRIFNNNGDTTLSSGFNWDVYVKIPTKNQSVQYYNNSTAISKNEIFVALVQDTDNALSINYVTEFFYSDT
jgi:hypothetical protein